MVKKNNRNGGRIKGAVVLIGLLLVLAGPVIADDRGVAPASTEMTAAGDRGSEKVIALLQELNNNNAREFRQIKREIAALGQQMETPGVNEIMGGIGYIFGLFGVAAYVMSRKKDAAGAH